MKSSELGALLVTLVMILGATAFGVVGSIAFSKTDSGGAKSFGLLARRLLRPITVVLIIYAAVMVSLLGNLDDALLALFGSIAGFVLGTEKAKEPDE